MCTSFKIMNIYYHKSLSPQDFQIWMKSDVKSFKMRGDAHWYIDERFQTRNKEFAKYGSLTPK